MGTSPQRPTKFSCDTLRERQKQVRECIWSLLYANIQSGLCHTHATREYKPFCFSRSPLRSRANRCLSSILLKSNESATKTTVKQQHKLLCHWVKRLMKTEQYHMTSYWNCFNKREIFSRVYQCVLPGLITTLLLGPLLVAVRVRVGVEVRV